MTRGALCVVLLLSLFCSAVVDAQPLPKISLQIEDAAQGGDAAVS